MVYYISAIVITMILCMQWNKQEEILTFRKADKVYNIIIVLLPLALLALFRWDLGVDSLYGNSYWQAYTIAKQGVNQKEFEIAFYWFMRLMAIFDAPYFWLLFVHEIIFFVCIGYALYRGGNSLTWSMLVFFLLTIYFDSYSSLRQSLAEAISLIAWAKMGTDKAGRKKDLSIIAIFIVATLFHTTSLINIPIYFLCKIRHKSIPGLLLTVGGAFAAIPIVRIMLPYFMEQLALEYGVRGLSYISVFISMGIFLCAALFYHSIISKSDNGYMYINQSLWIFIMMLNSDVMYLPFRVFDMLKIGYIFIVPRIVGSISDNLWRYIVKWLMMALLVVYYIEFLSVPGNPLVEYQSVFSDWNTFSNLP